MAPRGLHTKRSQQVRRKQESGLLLFTRHLFRSPRHSCEYFAVWEKRREVAGAVATGACGVELLVVNEVLYQL